MIYIIFVKCCVKSIPFSRGNSSFVVKGILTYSMCMNTLHTVYKVINVLIYFLANLQL